MEKTVFGMNVDKLRIQTAFHGLKLLPLMGDFSPLVSLWVDERLNYLHLGALSQGEEVLDYQLKHVQPTVLEGVAFGIFELDIAEKVAAVMQERAHYRAGQLGAAMRQAHDWLPDEEALEAAQDRLAQMQPRTADADTGES